ncbi:hypothetical protein PYW07_009702 [Mythimna separata]|uniref:Ion transport domain-containing protein n=1 Tax=Mythimna separata TaxID=271217 RepID=A0AAD7YCC4_MYTSE|nr:hypothetical protein PYW07_009702 [Mythimna separata]
MLKRNININREVVRVSYHTPRDSGQDKRDEVENDLDPVLERQRKSKSLDVQQAFRTDLPCKYDAVVKPFFPAAFATNLTMNTLEVLEGTLAMRRSANHVTKLNTRLIESIPGGDIAFMNRMMAMGANSNATCRLNHVSACHIAAMHDNEALDLLLRSGADISRADKHGRTPLHLAAWAGHAKQIALLLNFPEALRKSVIDRVALSPETLEEVKRLSLPVNKLTNIPCRLNVESTLPDEWSDGMEHNCRNVKEILPLFQQGWTALHSASARAQHHCVQLLLAAGADPNAQDLLCRTPLDVAGYAHYMGYNIDVKNFKETVNLLLNAGDKFQRCCHKSNPLDTPLHTAVELESEEVVEKMLLAGASATTWNSQGLTAMHLCVRKRSKELLQLLANHKSGNDDPYLATVDVKDRTGTTVLCAAVKSEWLQGVCIALGAGASITMKTDGESPIHIAALLGNIDILQEILTVAKYNSTIDFRNEKGETALFKAISHNQLDALKLLLEAGSSIEVEISDKANVFHVAAQYGNRDVLEYLLEYNSNITAKLINSDVWKHIIYLTVFLIAIQEIIFIKIKSKRHLLCLETWLKFWSIALALVLPRVVSWDTEYSPEWARLIATVGLLLTWFEMMFLISRFPNWGYYVLMFGKVANKVFKILVSFVFLIFGFSVSFMIQFRAEPPFEGPWSAFVTTMVMMTSEFDYNDTISEENTVNSSASIIILRLIFVSFLILVSIVLMNLLVGVAVNDVNNLEIIGSIKRLEKQVEFITSLEDIVFNKFIKKIVPKRLYNKWWKNKKWENVIVLRPREATCSNCNRLPARLREAIFEKAQSQKKQSDEEQGTMLYQMKLDEIYKVIVQKDGEPPKSENPDNALNKIYGKQNQGCIA